MNENTNTTGIDLDAAQLDKLEALARAATPGPWNWDENGSRLEGDGGNEAVFWPANIPGGVDARSEGWGACLGQTKSDAQAKSDADFIAAANPATVLKLLKLARRSTSGSDRCSTCKGNDADAPCAYPSEGRDGCLRDARLAASVGDDWAASTSSGCMYPNCQSKAEQDRIAAEVHRQLYSGSDGTAAVGPPKMPKPECLLPGVYAWREASMENYGAACFAAGRAAAVADYINLQDRSATTSGSELLHQMRHKVGGTWTDCDADGATCIKRMPHWADAYEFRTLQVISPAQQSASQPAATVVAADVALKLLQEFVDYHSKPAGMTFETAMSTDKLGKFLKGVEEHEKAMVQRARALLAQPISTEPQKQAMRDAWQVLFDAGVAPGLAPMSLADGIRAALAQPIVSPAIEQQGGERVAWLATDLDGRGDVAFSQEEAKRRAGDGCTQFFPLYAASTTAADAVQDEKDAARYRWLRDVCPEFEALASPWLYDDLDKVIDAAMSASQAQGGAA